MDARAGAHIPEGVARAALRFAKAHGIDTAGAIPVVPVGRAANGFDYVRQAFEGHLRG